MKRNRSRVDGLGAALDSTNENSIMIFKEGIKMTVRKLSLKWIRQLPGVFLAELRVVSLVVLLGVLGLLMGTSLQGQPVDINIVEDSRPLTPRGLENVVAFTRLLGYVRYFHPSDQAAVVTKDYWNQFAIEGAKAVEGANTPGELAGILDRLFRPIAPTVRVFPNGEEPQLPSELNPPAGVGNLQVVMWRHHGVSGDWPGSANLYRSERVRQGAPGGQVPAGFHDPRRPYRAELGGGLSGLVPLALWADANGTFPQVPIPRSPPPPPPQIRFSAKDRATRLAAVALAWNVFQHFYPYFDVVDTDWEQVLRKTLAQAAVDSDEVALHRTLNRSMIAQLQDGHAAAFHPSGQQMGAPRVLLDWIEDQIVVTYADEGLGVKPGDVVLQVDGRPAKELQAEYETGISAATPQWRRHKAVQLYLLAGAPGSSVTLQVQAGTDPPRTVSLPRTVSNSGLLLNQGLNEPRPAKTQELQPGIFYFDLTRNTDTDFHGMLWQLASARGVIFDMRGYPARGLSPLFLRHLIAQPVTSARFCVPVVTVPDRKQFTEFDCSVGWLLPPLEPRLRAKVAFLTNGRAISYAESLMGIVENYKLGEIVGGPTAGTNGDVASYNDLPGGFSFIWTGMKVLKHDGSRHHGVGILPTVPVARTIRGVREGRDEVLEKAIEVLGFKAVP